MKRALIRDLHAVAKERGAGYLEACLREGKVSADGQWVHFSDDAHARLRAQYNLLPVGEGGAQRRMRAHAAPARPGLGDVVHSVAGPIGAAIHWPCMKGDRSTDLKPGSPCDRARRVLNRLKV